MTLRLSQRERSKCMAGLVLQETIRRFDTSGTHRDLPPKTLCFGSHPYAPSAKENFSTLNLFSHGIAALVENAAPDTARQRKKRTLYSWAACLSAPSALLVGFLWLLMFLFPVPSDSQQTWYDDDVKLSFMWTPPEGSFHHYNIYVSVDWGEYRLNGTSFLGAYTVIGQNGHSYRIKVTAVTSDGTEGTSSPESDPVVCDTLAPQSPVVLPAFGVVDEHTVVLTIQGSPTDVNFSNYQLFGGQHTSWTDTAETVSFTFTVDPDSQNVLQIREKDLAGNVGPAASLTVENLSGDNDTDGIPNYWEYMYRTILNPDDPSDSGADSDGDRMSNLHEFTAGTDPTDASSVFAVLGIQKDSVGPGVVLSWKSVVDKRYEVLYCDSLQGEWGYLDKKTGTGGILTVADITPTTQIRQRFYRLEVW